MAPFAVLCVAALKSRRLCFSLLFSFHFAAAKTARLCALFKFSHNKLLKDFSLDIDDDIVDTKNSNLCRWVYF